MDELVAVDKLRERRHRVVDGDGRGAVEDHAHRALLAVLADEEHAAAEVRVEQVGPGDEQLSSERFHRHILTPRDRSLPVSHGRTDDGPGDPPRRAPPRRAAAGGLRARRGRRARPRRGGVLIRNAYISVDPYMRARMNAVESYAPSFGSAR